MGSFFYVIQRILGERSDHSSMAFLFLTLSTAHALKTHVKAPQTDFPVKPDNSSGPLTTALQKRLYERKQRPSMEKHRKSMEDAKRREDHPSPARTDSPPCSFQPRNRDQGPKGSIETKTSSLSLLRAMAEASKQQVSLHGSYRSGHLSHRGLASIGSGSKPHGLGLPRLRTVGARKRVLLL